MQKVNKLVLDNAKNLAIRLSSEEIRKRVFVLSTAAMSVSDLLDDGELKLRHKNSLFKITSLDDILEIADIYADDVRVDVRVIYDGTEFYVPKSHEKFYATPEIYLVVRMSKDLENIEPIGFVEAKELPAVQSNTEYYVYDVNILKPIGELKNAISKIEKKQQIFSKEAHEKIEELAIAFLDGEISDSEKVFFIQHVMKCPFCREKLSEMNEFDNVVRQLNKYPDLLNDQTLDILTGALARAYSLPEAQPVFLPEENLELIEDETEISKEDIMPLDEHTADIFDDTEEHPFLLEETEENIITSEEVENTSLSTPENETSDEEIIDNSIIEEETIENTNSELTSEQSENANDNEDDFLLSFADDETTELKETIEEQQPETNSIPSIQPVEDSMLELTDLELIDDSKNGEASEKENISELDELETLAKEDDTKILEDKQDELLTLDIADDDDVLTLQEQNEPLTLESEEQEENLPIETTDHLLLLGDEPEILEEEIEETQPDNNSEPEDTILSEKEEDIIFDEEKSNDELLTSENDETKINDDIQNLLDDDLKSLLDASDDEPVIVPAEKNETENEQYSETPQQIDPAIQNIMDDELMEMLMDEDMPSNMQEENQTSSVPKQIAEKLSQPTENGSSIEMLYEENNSSQKEKQITVEESPVVKSAVNKTKQIAVSVFLILILLAGGATTYFMKFNKAPNVTEGDENPADGGALFDFSNKPVDAEEPPVPQDINKSMTNVFSEQPTAITITKISWNVSDKLAQNDAFKNYLQVAGKNLQMNLQNDLANTTEFAYNNKIHLNFQVTKNNEIKNLQVLDSSGSEQIDNVVLRSIKETLKYINAPNLKDVKGDYNLSLMINF